MGMSSSSAMNDRRTRRPKVYCRGARWGRFPNMKTMWDRRCRLSIGTKGGNVLLGLDFRSLRLGPAATFFKGALPNS